MILEKFQQLRSVSDGANLKETDEFRKLSHTEQLIFMAEKVHIAEQNFFLSLFEKKVTSMQNLVQMAKSVTFTHR